MLYADNSFQNQHIIEFFFLLNLSIKFQTYTFLDNRQVNINSYTARLREEEEHQLMKKNRSLSSTSVLCVCESFYTY